MALTKAEQKRIPGKMKAKGLTLFGWARSRGFSPDSVKNVVYRDWGLADRGPVSQSIEKALREEDLV